MDRSRLARDTFWLFRPGPQSKWTAWFPHLTRRGLQHDSRHSTKEGTTWVASQTKFPRPGLVLAKNLWRSLASRQFSPLTAPTDACLQSAVMPSRFARVHGLKVVLDRQLRTYLQADSRNTETSVRTEPQSLGARRCKFSLSTGNCNAIIKFRRKRENPSVKTSLRRRQ